MVRTTQDSDIITEMRIEHIRPFIAALENEFYFDDEMIAESDLRLLYIFNTQGLQSLLDFHRNFLYSIVNGSIFRLISDFGDYPLRGLYRKFSV